MKHYEGVLGTFDYDEEEFEVVREASEYLHYCGKGNSVDLPEGFILGEKFNTGNVNIMHDMFCGCIFPSNFTLGDKFDARKVIATKDIFKCCVFPSGFVLPNHTVFLYANRQKKEKTTRKVG
ncbi:MAG: hypothetical protein NC309_03755 [Ruminococcus sp.]|nr:hypothetical protein [Ruminococcus sp.]